jgi:hypothetical protein
MVNFHNGMPRDQPDRYIAITKEPQPSKPGWWVVSLAIHEGDGPDSITIENPDGEEMTCEGAKTRATELAQSKGIQDVIILGEER